jgi:uncharacterized damage-inducible protein DinB
MTAAASIPSLFTLALGDLGHEIKQTRRILERVPDEHLDWRPHEKSMSLGGLARHLAELLAFTSTIVEQDEIDFATYKRERKQLDRRDDILREFDANAATLTSLLEKAPNEHLLESFTLRRGDHVMAKTPRIAALRSMGISHIVHHRGQLTVYLREVGVPVPGMYGPSADER